MSSTVADSDCLGFVARKGTLAACKVTGTSAGVETRCCPFCTFGHGIIVTAVDATGACYKFCSDCVPENFEIKACVP